MAFAERGILRLPRTFPRAKLGSSIDAEPKKYTQTEIHRMQFTPPSPEVLSEGRVIDTPVGAWSMDGDVLIFDSKSGEEIERITKESTGQKVKRIAIKILNMS